MRRLSSVPRKKEIFVVCEGQSERAYVALLKELAMERKLAVCLRAYVLRGGGPLAMVKRAIQIAKDRSYDKKKEGPTS
jgi:uncharacterized protein (UPF0303 family)